MALSSDRSATIRLSLAFSSSNWRSRFISGSICTAYFFRQLWNVASLIPAFRHTSPISVLSYASFRTKAICASVNYDASVELSVSRSRDRR